MLELDTPGHTFSLGKSYPGMVIEREIIYVATNFIFI